VIDKKTREELRQTFLNLAGVIRNIGYAVDPELNTTQEHVDYVMSTRPAMAAEIIEKWLKDERLKWEEADEEEDQDFCRACGRPE